MGSNADVAEIHNQLLMMLRHEISDPEIGSACCRPRLYRGGRRDHEGGAGLDRQQPRRLAASSIIFMDRDDLLNLYVVTYLPVPGCGAGRWAGADPWFNEPPLKAVTSNWSPTDIDLR